MIKIKDVNENEIYEYELKRDNKRPLKFNGNDAVIELDTHCVASDKYYSGKDWATHKIKVIKTTGNNCVLQLKYNTFMLGEQNYRDAILCKTIEQAENALNNFAGDIPLFAKDAILSNLKVVGEKYNWFEFIP